MRRQGWFVAVIVLFIASSAIEAFALPTITILNDTLNINVMSTDLESSDPQAPSPSQPPGTVVNTTYSGSLFDLGSGGSYGFSAVTNVSASIARIESFSNPDGWSMNSWVVVDDDTGLDFPAVDYVTAQAYSSWDAVFHVDGDGAGVNLGSWWVGTGESHSMASLFDLTLNAYVQSGDLQDDHTYRFLGSSEQTRLDGVSSGLDYDTGYYIGFYDAFVSVPEPAGLFLLATGGFLLFYRMRRELS